MRQNLLIAAYAFSILAVASFASADPRIQRALDLAEARYQQAGREAFQAQQNRDAAAQANADARANYDAAMNEQRAARRLLADTEITLPRAAEAAKGSTAAVEAERGKLAPFHERVVAAGSELRRRQDVALAPKPQWQQAAERVRAAEGRHQGVIDDRLDALYDNGEYLALIVELAAAEDAAFALRDTPNVDRQQLEDATLAWLTAVETVNRFESEALAADPAVSASQGAVDAEVASHDVLRARLVREVADDPAIAEAAAALTAEQGRLAGASENLRHVQAKLDADNAEFRRLQGVVASAQERLARVDQDMQGLVTAIAQSDEALKRADADLAHARNVEQLSLADRDAIAADLAAATYVPEPVYVPEPLPPVIIVDSGTSIVYCPHDCTKHSHSAHGRYRFRDHDHHDRDRDRRDDHDRNRDYGSGARRDDSSRRRNEEPERPRRDDDSRPRPTDRSDQSADERRKEEEAKAAARRAQENQMAPQPKAKPQPDSDATVRRQQEEAKAAAERRQREEAAQTAAAVEEQRRQESARTESRRQQQQQQQEAESRRRQQESEASARRQQQESEAAAKRQQQESDAASRRQQREQEQQQQRQQERQAQEQRQQQEQQQRESARSDDRGDRYRRR